MQYQERKKIQLKKLQAADIKIATAKNIGLTIEPKEGQSHEQMLAAENFKFQFLKAVDEYLKIFAEPVKTLDKKGNLMYYRCMNCDEPLGGLFGSFTWGIAHGEGFCSVCNYPARGVHYIEHEGVKMTVKRILQYHPSQLKRKKG